jgi:hypothetical protein
MLVASFSQFEPKRSFFSSIDRRDKRLASSAIGSKYVVPC